MLVPFPDFLKDAGAAALSPLSFAELLTLFFSLHIHRASI